MKRPHDDVGDGKPLVLLHAGVADRTMGREHLEPLADAGYRAGHLAPLEKPAAFRELLLGFLEGAAG